MGIFDIFNKKKNNVEKVEHKVPEYYGVTSDLLGEVEDLASKYLVDESMLDIYSKDKLEVKYLNEARQELEEALKNLNKSLEEYYDNEYTIAWFRGKEFFTYYVPKSLAEKSRKSDKDALEVMFYLEHERWPKEGELKNYNKTDVKTYVGSDFTIYEENGKYEIGIEKDIGGVGIGEVYYPITKE